MERVTEQLKRLRIISAPTLAHVKICLSTDNHEQRFNNSTEKLKKKSIEYTEKLDNSKTRGRGLFNPVRMRSTCCQNANLQATLPRAALHIDIIILPRDDKLSNKTIAVKFTTKSDAESQKRGNRRERKKKEREKEKKGILIRWQKIELSVFLWGRPEAISTYQ